MPNITGGLKHALPPSYNSMPCSIKASISLFGIGKPVFQFNISSNINLIFLKSVILSKAKINDFLKFFKWIRTMGAIEYI